MASHDASVGPARVLLDGLAYVESPRWHDGRLWFAHWGAGEVVAVDMDGRSEVVAEGPPGLGWSIDWLPDGRLLVTGEALMRREPDETMVPHADLSAVAGHGWNEIVVDGRGNIYINGADFDFLGGAAPKPGIIALVTPDGAARQVADGIEFPNGMLVTPDNTTLIVAESMGGRLTAFDVAADGSLSNRRVWAAGVAPDSICLDAEGAIWTHAADTRAHTGLDESPEGACVRAARCWRGSSSSAPASPARSADPTGGPCSCSRPTGGASSRSTRRSPTAPGRCWWPGRPHLASAGRDPPTRVPVGTGARPQGASVAGAVASCIVVAPACSRRSQTATTRSVAATASALARWTASAPRRRCRAARSPAWRSTSVVNSTGRVARQNSSHERSASATASASRSWLRPAAARAARTSG